jgi:hypothetical protein
MLNELNRLKDVGQFVFPVSDKNIIVGKETIALTPEQRTKYTKDSGQAIQDTWTKLMQSPKYVAMSDADKKSYLSNAMDDINAVTKQKTLVELGRQDLADQVKLTNQQKMLAASINDPSFNYQVKTPGVNASTDPKIAYQSHLDAYNLKVKDGSFTGPDKLTAEKSLAKEAITSQYPAEVKDFYSLSKADQQAYFDKDRAGATKLYDQAKLMDAALVAKGLTTTKFSTKSSGGTAKKSSGTKSSTKKATAKKGTKLDYSKLIAGTNSTALKNQTALRNLIKKSSIKRKVAKA